MISAPADAQHAQEVLFILDASNSMWGQINGEPKFDTARRLLARAVSDLPEDAQVGLVAYGHQFNRELGRCDDIELVMPMTDARSGALESAINSISPQGQTPIAEALLRSANWLDTQSNGNATLVLITDGQETCGGDPCAAANILAEANAQLTLHTIGYDLDAEVRDRLLCIAENGRGQYFDASDGASLQTALSTISEEITVAVRPASTETIVFAESFESAERPTGWTILNPRADDYVFTQGALTFIASDLRGLHLQDSGNVFTLDQGLPQGDWDLHFDLTLTMESGRSMVEFGLFSDENNHVAVQLWSALGEWCQEIGFGLLLRNDGAATTAYQDIAASSVHCGATQDPELVAPILETLAYEGARLTLSRRGQDYNAALTLPGLTIGNSPLEFVSPGLPSLRVRGAIAFSGGLFDDSISGNLLAAVHRIELVDVN
ncbi:MAG: VWA domain-containing protein [Pseudomonadota bacterium]